MGQIFRGNRGKLIILTVISIPVILMIYIQTKMLSSMSYAVPNNPAYLPPAALIKNSLARQRDTDGNGVNVGITDSDVKDKNENNKECQGISSLFSIPSPSISIPSKIQKDGKYKGRRNKNGTTSYYDSDYKDHGQYYYVNCLNADQYSFEKNSCFLLPDNAFLFHAKDVLVYEYDKMYSTKYSTLSSPYYTRHYTRATHDYYTNSLQYSKNFYAEDLRHVGENELSMADIYSHVYSNRPYNPTDNQPLHSYGLLHLTPEQLDDTSGVIVVWHYNCQAHHNLKRTRSLFSAPSSTAFHKSQNHSHNNNNTNNTSTWRSEEEYDVWYYADRFGPDSLEVRVFGPELWTYQMDHMSTLEAAASQLIRYGLFNNLPVALSYYTPLLMPIAKAGLLYASKDFQGIYLGDPFSPRVRRRLGMKRNGISSVYLNSDDFLESNIFMDIQFALQDPYFLHSALRCGCLYQTIYSTTLPGSYWIYVHLLYNHYDAFLNLKDLSKLHKTANRKSGESRRFQIFFNVTYEYYFYDLYPQFFNMHDIGKDVNITLYTDIIYPYVYADTTVPAINNFIQYMRYDIECGPSQTSVRNLNPHLVLEKPQSGVQVQLYPTCQQVMQARTPATFSPSHLGMESYHIYAHFPLMNTALSVTKDEDSRKSDKEYYKYEYLLLHPSRTALGRWIHRSLLSVFSNNRYFRYDAMTNLPDVCRDKDIGGGTNLFVDDSGRIQFKHSFYPQVRYSEIAQVFTPFPPWQVDDPKDGILGLPLCQLVYPPDYLYVPFTQPFECILSSSPGSSSSWPSVPPTSSAGPTPSVCASSLYPLIQSKHTPWVNYFNRSHSAIQKQTAAKQESGKFGNQKAFWESILTLNDMTHVLSKYDEEITLCKSRQQKVCQLKLTYWFLGDSHMRALFDSLMKYVIKNPKFRSEKLFFQGRRFEELALDLSKCKRFNISHILLANEAAGISEQSHDHSLQLRIVVEACFIRNNGYNLELISHSFPYLFNNLQNHKSIITRIFFSTGNHSLLVKRYLGAKYANLLHQLFHLLKYNTNEYSNSSQTRHMNVSKENYEGLTESFVILATPSFPAAEDRNSFALNHYNEILRAVTCTVRQNQDDKWKLSESQEARTGEKKKHIFSNFLRYRAKEIKGSLPSWLNTNYDYGDENHNFMANACKIAVNEDSTIGYNDPSNFEFMNWLSIWPESSRFFSDCTTDFSHLTPFVHEPTATLLLSIIHEDFQSLVSRYLKT